VFVVGGIRSSKIGGNSVGKRQLSIGCVGNGCVAGIICFCFVGMCLIAFEANGWQLLNAV